MALTTYSELKASVADWLHRSDLTTPIADFITLAEKKINRTIRLRRMEIDNTLSLTSGTRTVALPSAFIEPIALSIVISGQQDDDITPYYKLPQDLNINANTSARPVYWAVNGETLEFENPSDQTYSLSFRMLTGWDIANTSTNWLLTNHPDIYLYGSLLQATPYIENDARVGLWQSLYTEALKEVNENAARTKSLVRLTTDLPISGRSNIITGN
jgi:hypothetical protein